MARGVLITRCTAAVASAFIGLEALADGKVFARADAERVVTADQSALLAFSGGVETLIIETKAVGGGNDLGWIVPVPAEPEIEPATTGVFPTLRAVTAPEVVQPPGGTVPGTATLLVLSLIIGIGAGKRSFTLVRTALSAVLALLILVMFLPTLGRPRGLGGNSSVEALTRHIGSYEVTTLRGTDGGAVLEWLKANGYAVPDGAGSVLDDYAKRGWRFVASRLRRDAASEPASTVHPLLIRFATSEAVYPMRLTGVGQRSPLLLDLFVFGSSQAKVDGMEVRWCGRMSETAPEVLASPRRRYPRTTDDGETVLVSHTGLRAAITGAGVHTRLVGTIPVRDMDKDFVVRWDEYSPSAAWGFSQQGVYEVAALASAATLLVAVIVRALLRRRIQYHHVMLLCCLVLSLAVGVAFQTLIPQFPVVHGLGRYGASSDLAEIGQSWHWRADIESWPPRSAEEMRGKVRQAMVASGVDDAPEGDNPGCWTLRDGSKGAEIIVYDAFGSEYVYPLFWEPDSAR